MFRVKKLCIAINRNRCHCRLPKTVGFAVSLPENSLIIPCVSIAVQSVPRVSVTVSANAATDPHQQTYRTTDQKTAAATVQIVGQSTVVGELYIRILSIIIIIIKKYDTRSAHAIHRRRIMKFRFARLTLSRCVRVCYVWMAFVFQRNGFTWGRPLRENNSLLKITDIRL